MATSTPIVLSFGNPLLDIQIAAKHGEEYLEKYGLEADGAILAEEKHMPIYEDVVKNCEIKYVAGGAAQNTARAAAYVLPKGSVAYVGSVGDDDFKNTLLAANEAENVQSAYQVQPAPSRTGACAVVVSGHNRSLCTTLRAAEQFTIDHISKPEIANLISGAKYYYVEGYFLVHGTESILEVAKAASSKGKTVVLNLSAPYVAQFFKAQLESVLPYVDILIGNESEAAAYAAAAGHGDVSLESIASTLASFAKSNASRARLVIITQGANATLVASSAPSASPANIKPEDSNPKVYPVPKLSSDNIVDMNGAGDMFAGGVLGTLALGKDIDEAIEVGHTLGQMCCGHTGAMLDFPKKTIV